MTNYEKAARENVNFSIKFILWECVGIPQADGLLHLIVFIDSENYWVYYFSMSENKWKSKWSKDQVKAMLLEQHQVFSQTDTGIERAQLAEIERVSNLPHAVIISGLRRVGKSTLLAQLAHRLGKDAFYYINFEDDRFLSFQADDANDLYQALLELFGERKIFVIDEVQNTPGWEHFVRRFMEMGIKFYITGSNASLLQPRAGNPVDGSLRTARAISFLFSGVLTLQRRYTP